MVTSTSVNTGSFAWSNDKITLSDDTNIIRWANIYQTLVNSSNDIVKSLALSNPSS